MGFVYELFMREAWQIKSLGGLYALELYEYARRSTQHYTAQSLRIFNGSITVIHI